MQIIAGKARSLELSAPPGIGVRPTAGRSRKALFDSIGGALAGSCVLDLFSGSGALALEAASRGAAVLWMASQLQMHQQEMTWSEFVSEVEDDNVTDVYIEQSRAVPTGIVTLELKDDNSTRKVNVSNVEEKVVLFVKEQDGLKY